MLLVTGAVPTNQRRLAWLADLLPLAAIEVSHFLASVVGLTLWLGLFVYRHEAHSTQLWWQFALAGDAPRFLRVLVGMTIVVLLFALGRILGDRGAPARAADAPTDDRRVTPADASREETLRPT